MQIKSWQIASFSIFFPLALLLKEVSRISLYSEQELLTLGFFLGIMLIIALIPATLLKSDNNKKIGAFFGIILGSIYTYLAGLMISLSSIDNPGINISLAFFYYLLPGFFPFIAGIYYLWKKV